MADEWTSTFATIQRSHNQIFQTIDAAIRDEEQDQPQSAIINYKLAIVQIDEALLIPVQLPDDAEPPVQLDATWHDACQIIHKLKRTRIDLVQRISQLVAKHPPTTSEPSAPMADETVALALEDGTRPRTYAELATALANMDLLVAADDEHNGQMQLIYTCDSVRMYQIGRNGDVTTNAENCVLRILSLAADTEHHLQTTYFMQVILADIVEGAAAAAVVDVTNNAHFDNPWMYPLVAGASPCFYTEFGAFIFPDLHADEVGSAVGLVVLPASEHLLLEILEAILHGVVRQMPGGDDNQLHQRERRSSSEIVSDHIVRGATYVSQGLVYGSTKIGQLMTSGTPYLLSKLQPVPENAPPVSERVVNGVEVAKTATHVAVGVTGYVAGKIGAATMALGRFLAPHVQAQGSKLLSHTMGMSQEEANEKMTGVLTVAAGAVEGFGTVYTGLEESAAVLGTSLSDNSVKVIKHKYGPSAGAVAAGTFDTVGNMINISHNVRTLNPRVLAKRTGKALIQDIRPKNKDTNYIPAGSMYPHLGEFSKTVANAAASNNLK